MSVVGGAETAAAGSDTTPFDAEETLLVADAEETPAAGSKAETLADLTARTDSGEPHDRTMPS